MVPTNEDAIVSIPAVSVNRPVGVLQNDAGAATGVTVGLQQEERESPLKLADAPKTGVLDDLIQLCFERDDNTGKMVARVKNTTTGEVLRQIPPEEMLKLAKLIDQYLGLFVDRHS